MKKLLLLPAVLFLFQIGYSQIPYYDALKLKKLLDNKNHFKTGAAQKDSLFTILNQYTATPSALKDSIKNPFIFRYFDKTQTYGTSFSSVLGLTSQLSTAVGGIDVTTIANGIAALMIERTKEELTVAFFNRFKTFAANNPEFGILFPKTTSNLANLLAFNYPQMLPSLRDGFMDDLSKITNNLDGLLLLPKYQTMLKQFPEIKIAVRSVKLIREIQNKSSNAADIIKEFAAFPEWTTPNTSDTSKNNKLIKIGGCLNLITLFSESIRNDKNIDPTGGVWISSTELKSLITDPILFNIYLGLIDQQCIANSVVYNIDASGNKLNFSQVLATSSNDLFTIENKLQGFFDLTNKVNEAYTDIKSMEAAKETIPDSDYYKYINTSIDAIEYSFSIVKAFDKAQTQTTHYDDYVAILRTSNSLYKDIYSKKYTQIATDAFTFFTLLDTVVNANIDVNQLRTALSAVTDIKDQVDKNFLWFKKDPSKTDIDNLIKTIASSTAATLTPTIKAKATYYIEYYHFKWLLDFIAEVKPYALFMANMVEAKDEDAVKTALGNVILPVGSSSIKKNTGFNISVQSYLGGYLSINKNTPNVSTWNNRFGVIAPIGISLTPGFLSWKKAGSVSVFAELFDLGAIVDYKLQKDSSATSKQTVISKSYSVNLGQIFSPGIHLSYGLLQNIPLAIGFGLQYGPGLTTIDNTGNAIVNNPYWRKEFFLAVDIPFFTLANKTKKKQ